MLNQVQGWVGMLEWVPVWLEVLEQIVVWSEGIGHRQRSGDDGLMEQVPERDIGAGSLLAGDGGASCSPGGLGTSAGLDGCGGEGSSPRG